MILPPRLFFSAILLSGLSSLAWARPVLTKDTSLLWPLFFEAGFSAQEREDRFTEPSTRYNTTVIPVYARLGIHQKFDFGFRSSYISQQLRSTSAEIKGSQNALFSLDTTFVPTDRWGLYLAWHGSRNEKSGAVLPVARGDDWEVRALHTIDSRWPLNFNAGWVHKGSYSSQFGVKGGERVKVDPADIFQLHASAEIPLKAHLYFINEWAYYRFGKRRIGGHGLAGTSGEALDVTGGIGWNYAGWNIAGHVGTGLFEEKNTSFDLERGAGDVWIHFNLSYRFKLRKPYQ